MKETVEYRVEKTLHGQQICVIFQSQIIIVVTVLTISGHVVCLVVFFTDRSRPIFDANSLIRSNPASEETSPLEKFIFTRLFLSRGIVFKLFTHRVKTIIVKNTVVMRLSDASFLSG